VGRGALNPEAPNQERMKIKEKGLSRDVRQSTASRFRGEQLTRTPKKISRIAEPKSMLKRGDGPGKAGGILMTNASARQGERLLP